MTEKLCIYCGAKITHNDRSAYVRISGWAPVRATRRLDLSTVDRQLLTDYACGVCISMRAMGVNQDQNELFHG